MIFGTLRDKFFDKIGSFNYVAGNVAIGKEASEKIIEIESALSCPIARKVATMMATSHEYKKPNIDGALAMVKNYDWELTTAKIKDLQGLDKPINKEKVDKIALDLKGKEAPPLIVVNSLHGIRPQSVGKKILLDGHHRLAALEQNGTLETPVYRGTYTGGAQLSKATLRASDASEHVAALRGRTMEKM